LKTLICSPALITRILVVSLLFAAAGAWSLQVPGIPQLGGLASPFCFALICWAVFARNRLAALMIAGIVASWYISVGAAVWIWTQSRLSGSNLPWEELGGTIGGFFVVASVAAALPDLRRAWILAGGALIGLVAALPFRLWLPELVFYSASASGQASDPAQSFRISCALAIWQGALGAYLYIVSQLRQSKPSDEQNS
jgi:hypothetical protein